MFIIFTSSICKRNRVVVVFRRRISAGAVTWLTMLVVGRRLVICCWLDIAVFFVRYLSELCLSVSDDWRVLWLNVCLLLKTKSVGWVLLCQTQLCICREAQHVVLCNYSRPSQLVGFYAATRLVATWYASSPANSVLLLALHTTCPAFRWESRWKRFYAMERRSGVRGPRPTRRRPGGASGRVSRIGRKSSPR